ncbi:T9SS type A sorting domain-containing protein [uncultured Dokdonia sp.]|uniref:T9SS type A sorting domain-containing protein n=1 Tax=uncultured Dokdonia sp. TaxID=575653 RepID=UPI00263747A6|nr:T9SS type A sorting domain-containing protein [uncultured Dokdonia sp.]
MKKFILLLVLIGTVTVAAQNELWKPLKTGAGGWMTGLYVHPNGSPIYSRSDVGGAYRYDAPSDAWIQLVTTNSMPPSEIDVQKYDGVLSIVGADSNAAIAYMAFEDGIFKSENSGDTWEKTNFPSIQNFPNNDESKLSGERLSVDPINEEVVYFGSINDGMWVTFDGGTSWNTVTTVPSGTVDRGVREIKFDITSGSTNGRTNTLYASVDGEDVYVSIDAGVTWEATNSGITNPVFLDTEISNTGVLYIVGYDGNFNSIGAMAYDGAIWRTVFPSGTDEFLNIALDPFNVDRALVFGNGFTDTYQTANLTENTPTWEFKTKTRVAPNIPWMEWYDGDFFSLGEIVFDPVIEDKLWISDGVGTWTSTGLDDSDITWVETSKDQEHLVSNDIIGLTDGSVVTVHWDRPIFKHNDLDAYPETYGPINRFNSAWSLDRNINNPNFVVSVVDDHRFCCFDDGTQYSGYSEDGGETWTKFASLPEGDTQLFGFISVSATDINNIVWLPADNKLPYFTLDKGQTWNQASIPGASDTCCLSGFFFSRLALTADRVAPNTFYLYDFGNGFIHKTIDGGATWTTEVGLDSAFAFNGKLESVPDFEGHLFFANGIEQSVELIEGLKRSTDGGETWTTLSNTDKVLNVAIGAPEPNATYPTIFIQGEADGVYGIFKSINQGDNWTQIGTYPLGIYDRAKVFEANPFIPGVLYVGYAGNGFMYYEDESVLGVESAFAKADIEIFPNPTSDIITVTNAVSNSTYSLYNVTGQQLIIDQKITENASISLKAFTNGLYFLRVQSGGKVQTFKVIKK